MIGTDVPRQTAARYANAKYVDVEGADHLQIFGPSLAGALNHIDQWINDNSIAEKAPLTCSYPHGP